MRRAPRLSGVDTIHRSMLQALAGRVRGAAGSSSHVAPLHCLQQPRRHPCKSTKRPSVRCKLRCRELFAICDCVPFRPSVVGRAPHAFLSSWNLMQHGTFMQIPPAARDDLGT